MNGIRPIDVSKQANARTWIRILLLLFMVWCSAHSPIPLSGKGEILGESLFKGKGGRNVYSSFLIRYSPRPHASSVDPVARRWIDLIRIG